VRNVGAVDARSRKQGIAGHLEYLVGDARRLGRYFDNPGELLD